MPSKNKLTHQGGRRTVENRKSGIWQKRRKAKWRSKQVGSAVFKVKAEKYQIVPLILRLT